jgi:hypothetical protein
LQKNGLREIELGGDRLHARSVKVIAIAHDGKGIACERLASKNVENEIAAAHLFKSPHPTFANANDAFSRTREKEGSELVLLPRAGEGGAKSATDEGL